MFTVDERDRVRDRILALAEGDPRIVAGALIGSLATGPGDEWSDLDLGFAVAEGTPVEEVMADWTETLEREFGPVHLFDLPRGRVIYRVFLFPGYLQVDLSFAPASEFGARGAAFKLLFGEAPEQPQPEPPAARDLFGLGALLALHARFCIERGRLWQAQYWISELRNYGLALACLRRGLETKEGRGYWGLPSHVLAGFEDTLVRSIDRNELLRALARSVDALLREADEARDLANEVEPQLRGLVEDDLQPGK
jgi:hypothetical protein